MKFVDFVKHFTKVTLTAGQRAVSRVLFDGIQPCQLPADEREVARQVFGDTAVVPPSALATAVLVVGARSGKTSVFGALRALHLAITVPLASLAAGEQAYVIIVAPDLRLARQALSFALGAVRAEQKLKVMLVGKTADAITLRRPDGREVVIECLPATRGGSAIRGRTLLGAIFEECAFFRSDESVVNDSELFAAAAPRIVQGGQLILSSTPWTETGLLYEFFRDQHGAPRTAIVAHAPTLLMRPTQKARVEAEYDRDPINAAREFGAEFGSGGGGTWFDAQAVEDARDVGRTGVLAPDGLGQCVAAIDLAFSSDSSAIAVVRNDGPKLVLVDWLERRPTKRQPLKPSEVITEFALLARRHGCSQLVGDHHYSETAREHLDRLRMGFTAAPGGATGKEKTYRRAQQALVERSVSLPDVPRLLQQFRDVTAKQIPGGGVQISHPRRSGQGHGDLCAATILAIAQSARASRSVGAWIGPSNPHGMAAMMAATPVTGRSSVDGLGVAPDGTVRFGFARPPRGSYSGGGF